MKSKKLTSLFLAATMCAGLLSGCGDKEPAADSTPTPAQNPNDGANSGDEGNSNTNDGSQASSMPAMTTDEITLTYMHFDVNTDMVHHVGDEFMKKYPNIKVKYQDFDTNGYNDTLMNMISAQKAPDAFMLLGNCDFALSNCLFGDMTEYWENDPENQNLLLSINEYKIGYYGTDKKLATPIKYFPAALYADLTIFEQLNVTPPNPETITWQEFIDSVKATTSPSNDIYGLDTYYSVVTLYPIVNAASCIGEFGWNGRTFDMDLWATGLNQWAELINGGYRSPARDTPEMEAWMGDSTIWPGNTGKLAWQSEAYWTYMNLYDTQDFRDRGMQWVPYVVTNDAGTSFGVLDMGGISTGTKYPREAYELLKWMGWGVEGWNAKIDAYANIVSESGVAGFRNVMPYPITQDAEILKKYQQTFYPTAQERVYESAYDPLTETNLVTKEKDEKYGKYWDIYFSKISKPVPFGDCQIPGFAAFIAGVYNNTQDNMGVEALVVGQGKNAADYSVELAARALEYNQQALADAKAAYAAYGIELNYEVIK